MAATRPTAPSAGAEPARALGERPVQQLTSTIGDWITRGAFAGFAAGLVFILGQMAWATRSGKPAVGPLLAISTVFHGSSKPVKAPSEVVIGLVTHLNLSLAFGIGFAILVAVIAPLSRNLLFLALAGSVYGLVLWVINFEILGRTFFPFFLNAMGPPFKFEIFIHWAYGLMLTPFFAGYARRLPPRALFGKGGTR